MKEFYCKVNERPTMKETQVYRSEFVVFSCPKCGHKHMIDTADYPYEGNLDGVKTKCDECKITFWLTE